MAQAYQSFISILNIAHRELLLANLRRIKTSKKIGRIVFHLSVKKLISLHFSL